MQQEARGGESHSGLTGQMPRPWHHHRRTEDNPGSGDLSQGLPQGGGAEGERQPWAQLGTQAGRMPMEEPQV